MGVLQRFERRLEGLVEGAFARVFGGVVQPVEMASALQREAEDKKLIVAAGRVLVPNDYVVELGPSDSQRLADYDEPLRRELAGMLSEHAQEQGWSFVGPVQVRVETAPDLETGLFRVRGSMVQGAPAAPAPAPAPAPAFPAPAPAQPAPAYGPRLELGNGSTVPLSGATLVIGRSVECEVRLSDTSVSRRHAEVRPDGSGFRIVDLASTNGTTVNGQRVGDAALHDGDRIGVGSAVLVFRQGG